MWMGCKIPPESELGTTRSALAEVRLSPPQTAVEASRRSLPALARGKEDRLGLAGDEEVGV